MGMATVANAPLGSQRDLPEASGDGLTVRDVLRAPSLAESVVLAGHAGLGRPVRRLNVMEVPDILPWVKPDELLLTTAFAVTRSDASVHAQLLLDLVTALNARGLAAIAVKLGRYLDLMPQEVLDRANELGFPILQLPRGVAFDEVISDVFGELLDRQARALEQADALHRTISGIVLAGGGLPQIAMEVSRLLDCLILIAAPDGRVLAEHGRASDRSEIAAGDLFDASGRLRVARLGAGSDRLAASTIEGTGGIVAMTPILAAGVDHGRIVAYRPGGALPTGSTQALERAAIVAALSITKELAVFAVEAKFRGDYLRDILTGLTPVDETVVEHCRALGWDIDRSMVVIVAEVDPDKGKGADPGWMAAPIGTRSENERLAAAWQQVLRARDKSAPVVGFSQEVVALIPVDETDPMSVVDEVVAAAAAAREGDRSFCTGVSRRVSEPSDIPTAFAQARRAVRVGRRMRGPGSVSAFDSLGVHRLLSLVPDSDELRSFATEVLGELASDSASAADLRTTLRALLDTNLNVAEAARLLHFHYNGLRYRIAKLERIIGPFTSDPHLRLDAALALRIMEMRGI